MVKIEKASGVTPPLQRICWCGPFTEIEGSNHYSQPWHNDHTWTASLHEIHPHLMVHLCSCNIAVCLESILFIGK